MSKQANTKLIGGFVVGAIVLVVAGVLLFGSGKLFSHQRKFVLFFNDSVKGLGIGAPVDFKGVKVGTVSDVKIVLDQKDLSLGIPVFIEIDPKKIGYSGTEGEMMKMLETKLKGQRKFIELLIENGLKAQLEMQSLVTGQLGIHLDFFPNDPVKLVGTEPGYTEIPTVESGLSEFMKTVQNLPIAEIANKVSKVLDGIDKLVTSPDIKETLASLTPTVKAAHELLKNLDSQIKPLSTGAEVTMGEAKKMLANASKLAVDLDARLPQVVAGLEDTLKATGVTMRGANKAIDGLAGDNSPVRLELIKTLNEFSAAARSFRVLADYIENHPEALVRGKGK
ncbi:MAG: MlaD family protein [Syntrophobacteraceae bacterium]|jgi:paraquat-inducible protein B